MRTKLDLALRLGVTASAGLSSGSLHSFPTHAWFLDRALLRWPARRRRSWFFAATDADSRFLDNPQAVGERGGVQEREDALESGDLLRSGLAPKPQDNETRMPSGWILAQV